MHISDMIRAAQARFDTATAQCQAILDNATAAGRAQTTPDEDAKVDKFLAERSAAKISLDQLRAMEAEGADDGVRYTLRDDGRYLDAAGNENPATKGRSAGTPTGGATTNVRVGVGGGSSTERDDNAPRWVRSDDGRPAVVERAGRVADHEVVREMLARTAEREQHIIGQHGNLGQMIRSMTTTSGSAIVPTLWSADIIDRARNNAAVIKAGAEIVPMHAKTVQIGRLTTDPTAAFRAEGSTITASDPVFDNVTLTANTLSALVVGSLEWFQDAENVDEVVSEAIGKAVALQLDLTALFGGMTTGSEGFSLASPPNPRGILATLLAVQAANVLGSATNGTAQTALTYWNEVLDAIYTPRDLNEAPNAMIWNSKLARQYAKAYDSQGRILTPPPDVDQIERFISNQIPSFTQGTMTSRATDLFVGDFSQLLIGQRLDFTVQTLTERYAEMGQIGVLATFRGDVQLARPKAFSVYRYLQGA